MFLNSRVILKEKNNSKWLRILEIIGKDHECMPQKTRWILVCKKTLTFFNVKERLNVITFWVGILFGKNIHSRFLFGYELLIKDNSEIDA